MPTISMFFGIIIRMFFRGEHQPPHFHAFYQDHEAVFNMDGDLIDGHMPQKQINLIKAWTTLHQDELLADWKLAENKEPLYPIDPLR